MATEDTPKVRGWTQIAGSRKYHYFIGPGNSLCDRYMAWALDPNMVEDDKHDHPDNCLPCQRRRAKLEAEGKL